jgi:hypothetical protein
MGSSIELLLIYGHHYAGKSQQQFIKQAVWSLELQCQMALPSKGEWTNSRLIKLNCLQ